jgi:hypothetical protein
MVGVEVGMGELHVDGALAWKGKSCLVWEEYFIF